MPILNESINAVPNAFSEFWFLIAAIGKFNLLKIKNSSVKATEKAYIPKISGAIILTNTKLPATLMKLPE